MPVTLPPGRVRLATRPSLDRVGAGREHDRDRRGRRLGRDAPGECRLADDHVRPDGGPDRPPVPAVDRIGRRPSDIRSHTLLPLDIARFAQALAERRDTS